jgi:hypothetical protein
MESLPKGSWQLSEAQPPQSEARGTFIRAFPLDSVSRTMPRNDCLCIAAPPYFCLARFHKSKAEVDAMVSSLINKLSKVRTIITGTETGPPLLYPGPASPFVWK